ncbi:FAD-dependent monooxygenase [Paracandidimonas lactea]|uniref:FAD-dependent monooxygenase n=1 Tax=Paracandidimonas lactea TaxID=2895524 RepID=UPI001F00F74B|nr:FAD-dependent monooxygenase [Paracandidimonas lactea]
MPTYDIAISGAGPVGCTLALLLARRAPHPERILVLGRGLASNTAQRPPVPSGKAIPPAFQDPGSVNAPKAASNARAGNTQRNVSSGPQFAPDPRTLALNQGSRALLDQLGAAPANASDILTVHVSQQGRLGRTLIQHKELGVPRLGCVAGYDAVVAALRAALGRSGVTLSDEDTAPEAIVTVRSDGARPRGLEREYGQHALLATVRAARPQAGWAFERFTRHGPLALLPHPAGPGIYSLVWCNPPELAEQLRQLSQAEFEQRLHDAFGDRMGALSNLGERHVFPLSLHAGPTLNGARSVAIGNAAQTLHPVAGQGLNLGLRDAAQLAIALRPWMAQPSIDPAPLLAEFATRRRPDRWLTMAVTDFLPRIFATGNPLVEHAAGLALLGMDVIPALRTPLARHLLQGLRA